MIRRPAARRNTIYGATVVLSNLSKCQDHASYREVILQEWQFGETQREHEREESVIELMKQKWA